jgi:hypothetical protein
MKWEDLQQVQELLRKNNGSVYKLASNNPVCSEFKASIGFEGPRGVLIPPLTSERPTLHEALIWYQNKVSMRPEDSVYGLIGLMTAYDEPWLVIDCSRETPLAFIGDMGVEFWEAQVGDMVCILLGCSIPVVLRPVGNHYTLVGEAYIDGYMYGKGMIELDEGKYQLEDFDIH